MEYYEIQVGPNWTYYVSANEFAKLTGRSDRFAHVQTFRYDPSGHDKFTIGEEIHINPDWVVSARKMT
jgi:hypothetical protein